MGLLQERVSRRYIKLFKTFDLEKKIKLNLKMFWSKYRIGGPIIWVYILFSFIVHLVVSVYIMFSQCTFCFLSVHFVFSSVHLGFLIVYLVFLNVHLVFLKCTSYFLSLYIFFLIDNSSESARPFLQDAGATNVQNYFNYFHEHWDQGGPGSLQVDAGKDTFNPGITGCQLRSCGFVIMNKCSWWRLGWRGKERLDY